MTRVSTPLLLLLCAGLAAGCGPEVWQEERELTRVPQEWTRIEVVPRVDPLLAAGQPRRFQISFEESLRVVGRRQVEVIEFERPFDPWIEGAEMLCGTVLTPFWIVLFPVLYPVSRGVGGSDASLGGYFAVIGTRLLNPTRNDLFPGPDIERVVEHREDRYEETVFRNLPPEAIPALEVEVIDLVAVFRTGSEGEANVADVGLEPSGILTFIGPQTPVDRYRLRIRVGERVRTVEFGDY